MPKRSGGRKPLDPTGSPSVPVHVTMTVTQLRGLRERAAREGITVQERIRRDLREAEKV